MITQVLENIYQAVEYYIHNEGNSKKVRLMWGYTTRWKCNKYLRKLFKECRLLRWLGKIERL